MSIKIVIPVLDQNKIDAQLSPHFGRAPYFAVVEMGEDEKPTVIQTVPNTGEHFGGNTRPAERIIRLNPNFIVAYSMGRRALDVFQEAHIAVLRANADTVKEVLTAFNQDLLEELTDGCSQARHH
ncbi:MAG: NifB/NifX family molybdenum-iron cluster-binding protein [Candidatus Ranarchaeia archaeon]